MGTSLLAVCALVSLPELRMAVPVPSLPELLKEYRDLGLPFPPTDAPLVRMKCKGGWDEEGKKKPDSYELYFQLKPATKTHPATLYYLTGEWPYITGREPIGDAKPDASALKDTWVGSSEALFFAIQCHARGWKELAEALRAKIADPRETRSVKKRLLDEAEMYWKGRIIHPTQDRKPILKHLKDLMKRDPDFDHEDTHELIKSLELTLAPGKGKPGSVEALIDDLVDCSVHPGNSILTLDERYRRIAELGFDAMPDLIEHLGDERLLRMEMQGLNYLPRGMRVKELIAELIEGLADQELKRDPKPYRAVDGIPGLTVPGNPRQGGWPINKAAAEAWWDQARKEKEEEYLLARVIPSDPEKEDRILVKVPLLRVIAAKYPSKVPDLYRTVLEKRKKVSSAVLVDAISKLTIPEKDKVDLLIPGAKHKDTGHHLSALAAVKVLDKKQFEALLTEAIRNFPKDAKVQDDHYSYPSLAQLVLDSDNAANWPLLEQAAKRASVTLRVEILDGLDNPMERRWRSERLKLFAAFLDDAEDLNRAYAKQVRDSAARNISEMLDLDLNFYGARTSVDRTQIRDQVRQALKKELAKPD